MPNPSVILVHVTGTRHKFIIFNVFINKIDREMIKSLSYKPRDHDLLLCNFSLCGKSSMQHSHKVWRLYEWVSVKGSTSHSTHYRSHYGHFGDDFYRPDDQTNSVSIKTIWPCNAFLSYGTSVSGLCMSCTETFISDFLPLNGSTSYTCYGQPMHQIWTLPFSSSVI